MSGLVEPGVVAGVPGWGMDGIEFQDRPAGFTFNNPLYQGADPWVVRRGRDYYLCKTGPGGRLEVWKSGCLTHRGQRRIVWAPPRSGWNRAQVWAPELHELRGRWYIYYAASNGRNANHRMGVLESAGPDPQGQYIDRGTLYTGDDAAGQTLNRWAIDGTVLELNGRLYFIWSGWEDHRDVQHLYVAPMSDPCTVSGNRVRLCANDCHDWERVGERQHERGLNEGPQLLRRNGRVFLIYSCSGSWQPSYKLGMLYMDERDDPADPRSWRKHPAPVFEPTREVFGVGHCCFTQSPDGRQDWLLYHSKRRPGDCWDRVVRAQPFVWTADGMPDFGRPLSPTQSLAMPSGHDGPSGGALYLPHSAGGGSVVPGLPEWVAAAPDRG